MRLGRSNRAQDWLPLRYEISNQILNELNQLIDLENDSGTPE